MNEPGLYFQTMLLQPRQEFFCRLVSILVNGMYFVSSLKVGYVVGQAFPCFDPLCSQVIKGIHGDLLCVVAITASITDWSLPVLYTLWDWPPPGDLPHAIPGVGAVDQREVPAELDHAGQLAALVIGEADGVGGGFVHGEHAGDVGRCSAVGKPGPLVVAAFRHRARYLTTHTNPLALQSTNGFTHHTKLSLTTDAELIFATDRASRAIRLAGIKPKQVLRSEQNYEQRRDGPKQG